VGLVDGLGVIDISESKPRWLGQVEGIEHEVRSIAEDKEGLMWAGLEEISVFRLGPQTLEVEQVRRLIPGDGFDADLTEVEIAYWEEGLIFGTSNGLMKLNAARDSLIETEAYEALNSRLQGTYVLRTDAQSRLWLTTDLRPLKHGFLRQTEGEITFEERSFRSITEDVWAIYPQDQETVWMGGVQSLMRVDLSLDNKKIEPFISLIREVRINSDSVLFQGAYTNKEGVFANQQPDSLIYRFPSSVREIDFRFISPVYAARLQPQYRYRLEGYEKEWSDWKNETHKSYTGLREGEYRFRVEARDAQGNRSEEAIYQFSIRPPWYRTWWAGLLYLLILFGAIYLLVRWRLRQQSRQLEQKERELALEREATEKLRKLDLLKDEFLATTSHELRTPLQGIIGLAESLRDRLDKQDRQTNRHNLDLIVSSGQRLASLVNDILDFSRLKTYTIDLQRKAVDLHALGQLIIQLNQTLIGGKDLRLHNEIPEDLPLLNADENRLQQILQNLIGNAIKFTEKG
ncbi:MAG: histidine kinase dimerization/phospho-acceptor domain-containing protein, partial [Bacteroidota bacterium]